MSKETKKTKKPYVAPAWRIVAFKVERGFNASGRAPMLGNESVDQTVEGPQNTENLNWERW